MKSCILAQPRVSMRLGIIIGGLVLGSHVNAGESGGDAMPKFQYPPEHPCSVSARPLGCRALDRIAYPDWKAAEDLLIVPHRGLWGFGDYVGVPENSAEGFVNVAVAGYSGLEADFMPSVTGTMMSHDYVLTRLTSAPPSDRRRVYEQKSEELERLRLRDRAGKVTEEHFASFASVKNGALATDFGFFPPPAIFVDIKSPPGDPEHYALNWVHALRDILAAAPPDQLYRYVTKTPYTPSFIRQHLGDQAGLFDRVLWMPQVATDDGYEAGMPGMGSDVVESSADFVDLWNKHGGAVAYETNYKNAQDSRLQAFDHELHGEIVRFANILDYIRQQTGLRGGIFAEEPVGQRGVVNREAIWAVKDARTDRRGDFIFEALTPPYGEYVVVTTDRPDVWLSVKNLFRDE